MPLFQVTAHQVTKLTYEVWAVDEDSAKEVVFDKYIEPIDEDVMEYEVDDDVLFLEDNPEDDDPEDEEE